MTAAKNRWTTGTYAKAINGLSPTLWSAWIGGFYETMPTTNFWLLHAGCAAGSGLCFVLFKFVAGHHLEAEG